MKLTLTDTNLHTLERILDATRDTSDTCKVPKEALRQILRDHIALNSEVLRKHGALPETMP